MGTVLFPNKLRREQIDLSKVRLLLTANKANHEPSRCLKTEKETKFHEKCQNENQDFLELPQTKVFSVS